MPSEEAFYRAMLRIRLFEEHVLDSFPQGLFYGTTHTYIGQEANAVAVLGALQDGDIVVSNHRCHGHFLAYGGSMHALAAELMGRQTGVCGGRGGSQHIQWRDFYANGILGGTLPLAVGMSLAEKGKGSQRVVVAFTGDGALGEGVVYESLNMAALWSVPLLIVLENNRYAQSTPIGLNLAGGVVERFEAFGVPAVELEATDVVQIHSAVGPLVARARDGGGPQAFVLRTYRLAPHSKGDDTRDPAEIERFRQRDPLKVLERKLPEKTVAEIRQAAEAEVAGAFEAAAEDPLASPAEHLPVGMHRP